MQVHSVVYTILIFIYIFIRLIRDQLVHHYIASEATSYLKIISLFAVLCYFVIHKLLLRKLSTKWILPIFLICLSIFLLCVPDHFEILPAGLTVWQKILHQPIIVFYYLWSELLAFTISGTFWIWFNRQGGNVGAIYNAFILSQIGLFSATSISALTKNLSINILHYGLAIVSFLASFLVYNYSEKEQPQEEKESKPNNISSFGSLRWIIIGVSGMTFLCAMLAGLIDPYYKYLLKIAAKAAAQVPQEEGAIFRRYMSIMWLIQSFCTLLFGYIFKRYINTSIYFTPLIMMFLLTSMYISGGEVLMVCLTAICLKIFKYSSHSPGKESLIQNLTNVKEMAPIDGVASRVGKVVSAIILVGFWTLSSYTWATIPIIWLLLLVTAGWLTLGIILVVVKKNMSDNNNMN